MECPSGCNVVSILVLMDFRLKAHSSTPALYGGSGFNPCSNGLSAQRRFGFRSPLRCSRVSILVLMDFRLKGARLRVYRMDALGFNPCSNGLSAQRPSAVPNAVLRKAFQSLF